MLKEILKKFKIEDCKSLAAPMDQNEKFCKEDGARKVDEGLYKSLIGFLMYLTATRYCLWCEFTFKIHALC